MPRKNHKFYDLDCAEASFNVLFEQLSADGSSREIVPGRYHAFLEMLRIYLRKERAEHAGTAPEAAAAFCSGEPDTVDALNALAQLCGRHSFGSMLDGALFEALLRLHFHTL